MGSAIPGLKADNPPISVQAYRDDRYKLPTVDSPDLVDEIVGDKAQTARDNPQINRGRTSPIKKGEKNARTTSTPDGSFPDSGSLCRQCQAYMSPKDNITEAFLNSSRKTLRYIPQRLNLMKLSLSPLQRWLNRVPLGGSHSGRIFFGATALLSAIGAYARANWRGLQQGQRWCCRRGSRACLCDGKKHTQVPVWIRIRHLPMEYWTEEGLSAVASGIGIPLYTDKITQQCLRLDFARVCVMLSFSSKLPKHLVILRPAVTEATEIPIKVDIEYEWLPLRCKQCSSLGHCNSMPRHKGEEADRAGGGICEKTAVNDGGPCRTNHEVADTCAHVVADVEPSQENCGSGKEFIHCALLNKRTSTKCLISVVYGDCEAVRRRPLWESLLSISEDSVDDPWCVLGDFNAIVDPSESCGRVVEPTSAMAEFSDFITDAALVHLPFQGCPYTWHNCSEGIRSLWRRLDRVLVNEVWLLKWPRTSYLSALPSTSDHSPIVLRSEECRPIKGIFRFDNFLTKQPGFLNAPHLKHILNTEEAAALVSPITHEEIKEAFYDIRRIVLPGRMDFRPIACCNVLYKAITKILVRRMQQVLDLLIDYSQNAFVPGNLESVRTIKHTLAEFAEMSGLHVNPNKSTIILSKAVRSERMAILDFMGFQEAVLPIKYLGCRL
ncbi:UNVERIFIED_CONTAM: hypothetical protein Sradi_7126100 [Sesamum radiatum]|uniref:Reverse transcriptase domain-containing protein n=1 Tax=Sesamum radiatum TaxID=300843 RepID=A0AAW2J128_SESRA